MADGGVGLCLLLNAKCNNAATKTGAAHDDPTRHQPAVPFCGNCVEESVEGGVSWIEDNLHSIFNYHDEIGSIAMNCSEINYTTTKLF